MFAPWSGFWFWFSIGSNIFVCGSFSYIEITWAESIIHQSMRIVCFWGSKLGDFFIECNLKWWGERQASLSVNTVTIFPIKKRISTELFIGKSTALHKGQKLTQECLIMKGCIYYVKEQLEHRSRILFAYKCSFEGLNINVILKWEWDIILER